MVQSAYIPTALRGDAIVPLESSPREPSDPPVRFVERTITDDEAEEGEQPSQEWANGEKSSLHLDYPDSDETGHRVPPSRYDEGLVAPPTVNVARLPNPFVTCGCEEWVESHHNPTEADTVDVCPSPRPMTRGAARDVYRRVVKTNRQQEGVTSKIADAERRYARIRYGDAYLRATMDGQTTVLVSLRLSPCDDDGRVVTPYQLTEDLYANLGSVTDATRYSLGRKYGFDYHYIRITSGTREWVTPHVHFYLYVEDPNDAVDAEMFRSAVTKHVDRNPRASWQSHDVIGGRTVRIEHDPLLATETDDRTGDIDGLRDVQGTRGALYVAHQLPHFALRGDTEPWEIDRAVAAWVSPRRWFQPSRDFPDRDDVKDLI